jgi:molecular chaperone DnaJ
MAKDYYATLGLSRGASQDDIKKAYRRLSKEHHPDKHKGDKSAEHRFKEVNEAYEVLSNPKKKQMYDQFGEAGVKGGAGGFGGFGAGGAGAQGFNGFDFSAFTGDLGSFASIFDSFFGGEGRGPAGGRAGNQQERGSDREVEVRISFDDVVKGAQETVTFTALRTCPTCSGSGAEQGSNIITCPECQGTGQITRVRNSFLGAIQERRVCPRCGGAGKIPERQCRTCNGAGRVSENVEVQVRIPAGIHDGQTLRLRGEGDSGPRGAPAGDLYVHVHVRPDRRFERDGDDIRSTVTVSVLDAIAGAEIPVETVHGTATVKIPAGTQPNEVFRLKGKGLPVLNTHRVGDQYVTVNVEIPKKLSREERRLLDEWKRLRS